MTIQFCSLDRNFFYLSDDSVLVTKIGVSSVCNGPVKEIVVLRAKTLKFQSINTNQNHSKFTPDFQIGLDLLTYRIQVDNLPTPCTT